MVALRCKRKDNNISAATTIVQLGRASVCVRVSTQHNKSAFTQSSVSAAIERVMVKLAEVNRWPDAGIASGTPAAPPPAVAPPNQGLPALPQPNLLWYQSVEGQPSPKYLSRLQKMLRTSPPSRAAAVLHQRLRLQALPPGG